MGGARGGCGYRLSPAGAKSHRGVAGRPRRLVADQVVSWSSPSGSCGNSSGAPSASKPRTANSGPAGPAERATSDERGDRGVGPGADHTGLLVLGRLGRLQQSVPRGTGAGWRVVYRRSSGGVLGKRWRAERRSILVALGSGISDPVPARPGTRAVRERGRSVCRGGDAWAAKLLAVDMVRPYDGAVRGRRTVGGALTRAGTRCSALQRTSRPRLRRLRHRGGQRRPLLRRGQRPSWA